MNLLKNFGNSLKDNLSELKSKPRSKTTVEPLATTPPRNALSRAARTQSLSQISALHSHRNMKISLQIQLAESMFVATHKLVLDSKLSPDFGQCLSQQNMAFPFFVQYVDSLEPQKQILIKAFLQAKCLVDFIKSSLPSSADAAESLNNSSCNSDCFRQFCDDFERILQNLQSAATESGLDLTLCKDYETLNDYYLHKSEEFNDSDEAQKSEECLPIEMEKFFSFVRQIEYELEKRFYSHFLCSKYFRMLEYEVLCDSESLQLADILYASTPIASTFLEFMDQEGLKRFVEFLIMHRNFEQYSGQLADALAIYDRFFNLANKCSSTIVELSDKSYKIVEDSLQGSAFSANCFDQIASMFTQYFTKTYFPQFLQNELFADYLKSCEECFRSLKNKQTEVRKMVIMQKQLSVDSAPSPKAFQNRSIWKRNDGQMNLAFIDNYGRINSFFQRAVPDAPGQQNSTNKLSQVIKKLTLNDEEEKKRKEEDAWRIAQSIINDVCSVTSTQPAFP